jgi:hypothetical protein
MFNFSEDSAARQIHELQKSAGRDAIEDSAARKIHEAREALQKSAHDTMLKSLGLFKPPAPAAIAKASATVREAIAKAGNIPLKKIETATSVVKVGDLLLGAVQPRRALQGEREPIDYTEDFAARQLNERRDAEHASFAAALKTPYCSSGKLL